MKSLLNVGSGGHSVLPTLQLSADEWTETHFDVQEVCEGCVVGTVLELDAHFEPQSFDIVMCSHMLEHIDPWNTIEVLRKFQHVLKPSGQVVIVVPDIEEAARVMVETHSAVTEVYKSVDGLNINVRDMLYGHGESIRGGMDSMRHRTAFTANDLAAIALTGGFSILRVEKRPASLEVVLVYR